MNIPWAGTGYFEASYEEYHITICGQTVILINGELAARNYLALQTISVQKVF